MIACNATSDDLFEDVLFGDCNGQKIEFSFIAALSLIVLLLIVIMMLICVICFLGRKVKRSGGLQVTEKESNHNGKSKKSDDYSSINMETLDQPPKEYEVLKHSSVPGPNKGEESQTVRIEIDDTYDTIKENLDTYATIKENPANKLPAYESISLKDEDKSKGSPSKGGGGGGGGGGRGGGEPSVAITTGFEAAEYSVVMKKPKKKKNKDIQLLEADTIPQSSSSFSTSLLATYSSLERTGRGTTLSTNQEVEEEGGAPPPPPLPPPIDEKDILAVTGSGVTESLSPTKTSAEVRVIVGEDSTKREKEEKFLNNNSTSSPVASSELVVDEDGGVGESLYANI